MTQILSNEAWHHIMLRYRPMITSTTPGKLSGLISPWANEDNDDINSNACSKPFLEGLALELTPTGRLSNF